MKLMHSSTIIFITGGPGTGKSFAAREIAGQIDDLTLISYDAIKEKEWDRFGFDTKEEKDRLNWFSLEEFNLTLQKCMREGKTILTEYPFYERHRDELHSLVQKYNYSAITLLLEGDWRVIYDRGIQRDKSGNASAKRHPGHLTNHYLLGENAPSDAFVPDAILTYEEFRSGIDAKNYDIQIGETIRIDVTDLDKTDYERIISRILEIDSAH